ncbi:hypothetical protein EVAR_21927_1 [Eumeta japonica]|uniref:Uncharacterized protein n=1 Tax=Eumeta variegata TaxID=151549 RepID=A0A4C1XK24_EUMVA|nr:hypothetical protein EVAR_21927_1 [Eumeta japonica]
MDYVYYTRPVINSGKGWSFIMKANRRYFDVSQSRRRRASTSALSQDGDLDLTQSPVTTTYCIRVFLFVVAAGRLRSFAFESEGILTNTESADKWLNSPRVEPLVPELRDSIRVAIGFLTLSPLCGLKSDGGVGTSAARTSTCAGGGPGGLYSAGFMALTLKKAPLGAPTRTCHE